MQTLARTMRQEIQGAKPDGYSRPKMPQNFPQTLEFGRVHTGDGICPYCDDRKTILRPPLVRSDFPNYNALRTPIYGLPCPNCQKEEARRAFQGAVQNQIKGVLLKAGVPKKFSKYTLDSFKTGRELERLGVDPKQARLRIGWKKVVADYLANLDHSIQQGIGLSLFGSVGTGKTMLMGIVVRELARKGHPVVFIPERGIFEAIKTCYDDTSKIREKEIINQFGRVKVLVIDDFGVKAANDWRVEIYYDIIDQRYDNNLPTFVSSNTHPNDLGDIYVRQMDRLARNTSLVMVGDSLRGSRVEMGTRP